jgi:methylase of polypeptide subunit release factors
VDGSGPGHSPGAASRIAASSADDHLDPAIHQDGRVDDAANRPAPILDRPAIGLLQDDLAGFTVETVTDLLGPVANAALAREQPVPAHQVVQGCDEPLAALVAAFVLGLPVPRRRLDAALPRLGTDGAIRLGLLTAAGHDPQDPVRALVDLRPYAAADALGEVGWWVASDLTERATSGPLRPDHVLGIGGASLTLARCTPRSPVARALDLGTGCGVQALHAVRHADAVTATDLSARALRFARFTLALNSITEQVQLRRGDLLEPVTGQRFDLVVSNPPFVITPRGAGVPDYEYRDAGRVGDAVVEELVTGVGDVLAPGGVAVLLGNWEHRAGVPWTERVGDWLSRSGLDGWVLQREVQDPAEYAELWLRDAGRPGEQAYRAMYRAWLDDFTVRRVDAVGLGLVVLRRPLAGRSPSLHRVEDVAAAPQTPPGDHFATCLAAHDWLVRTDDHELLTSRLRTAPDVTEERYHTPGDTDPQVILLRQGAGLGRTVRADTALAGFVGASDGELTVGQLIGALGQLLDRPVADVEAGLLPAVRVLVGDGMLLPVKLRPRPDR